MEKLPSNRAYPKLLLESGANANAKDTYGDSALTLGIRSRTTCGIVKLLLEKGADVNLRGVGGRTALMEATKSGSEDTVQVLIEGGADIDVRDKSGNPVLILGAMKSSHVPVVKLLLDSGVNIDSKGAKGRTALMVAARHGLKGMTQFLLEAGADVDLVDDDGKTVRDLARGSAVSLFRE